MHPLDLDNVKSRLQRRRRQILQASLRTAAEIAQLRGAERDAEVEEGVHRHRRPPSGPATAMACVWGR